MDQDQGEGTERVGDTDTKDRITAAVEETLPPIPDVEQRAVGEEARAAVLLWPEGRPPPRDVVVFLHGWSLLFATPAAYGDWIGHLLEGGSTVVFPTYLERGTRPRDARGNALAGIAAALEELGERPQSLVVAGHTTGGALALDYAAVAARKDMPRPDAVFAAFPGRNPGDEEIPAADPERIAPRTRIAVVSGPANPVVRGRAQARKMVSAPRQVPPENRRLLTPEDADFNGPLGSDARDRRAFWRPLDRMINEIRAPVSSDRGSN